MKMSLSPGSLCQIIPSRGIAPLWSVPGVEFESNLSADDLVLVVSVTDGYYVYAVVDGQVGHVAIDYLEKA